LANCGNLKFPDLNFTDFGEKTLNFTNFGLKKQVLAMFDALFVRKIFFHPNLRGDSPGKIISGTSISCYDYSHSARNTQNKSSTKANKVMDTD
jgi:hypothetical protein